MQWRKDGEMMMLMRDDNEGGQLRMTMRMTINAGYHWVHDESEM